MTTDSEVLSRIGALVDEEHGLLARSREIDGLAAEDHDRLQAVEVELDQCWDLLRQRRARRAAGQDPDQAAVRGEVTVEHYSQ
jgi:Protein of unknown function (DUF2630)